MSLTKGTAGQQVQVFTNSFKVSRLPSTIYYHYDVGKFVTKRDSSGERAIPSSRRVSDIVDKLQTENPRVFNPRAAFDGVKNLFMTKELQHVAFEVNMGTPGATSGQYSVRLALVGQINPSDIEKLTTSRGADSPITINNANTIALTLLQVILSQGPQLQHNFSLHAKSFYLPTNQRRLSGGIMAWKGFFQSVRPTAGRIVVNVDTTTAVFYEDLDLISSACKVLNCRETRELVRACAADQRFQTLRGFLKGVLVIVQPGNRTKRIADLVRSAGDEEFFKDDQKISVAEYWTTHHNRPLRYPDVFGIKLKSGAIFPAEACKIKSGQRYKKRLSPEDTSEFIRFSVTRPKERLQQVETAISKNLFNYSDSPWMLESGMRVESNPLTISGRALPSPGVVYGNCTMDVSSGAWNVARAKLRAPSRIKYWAIVVFDDGPGVQDKVNDFEKALVKGMRNIGMVVENGAYKEIGNIHDIQKSVETCALGSVRGLPLVDGMPPKPSIVVVILPQGGNEVRREVKVWGDVRRGIPTQCVKAGNYDKDRGRDQYCGNVALKINMKTGGINSYVQPSTGIMGIMKESMMVGCDVTHPAPGVTTRPSVASLVSSIDEGATRYKVFLDAQPPRQEMITNISAMLEAGLRSYQAKRGKLPKNIFLYRDGVSEGEYWKVDTEEIRPIEELLAHIAQVMQSAPPQLVFIVVGKRHHIRFFPRNSSDADKSGNCKPGLVVDDGIVHSKLMDFYLQSHAGLIGTSRPSHYVVLRNGPQYSADQMQELSYALCFVYATATRSVSIPAPVYYADKACTRAEFQFDPRLRFMDDASSDGATFDLGAWRKGLAQSPLSADMYFL